MKRSTSSNTKRSAACIAVAALMMCFVAGSATNHQDAPAREGAGAASTHTQVADRTLVPRRIRLIIGYKRPRLA